jgi:hypothetical protein
VVRVEAPPSAPTSSPRDPTSPWLGVVAVLLLADSILPWERSCADAFDGFPARCFSARLWSGSASLLGLVALVLLVVFVIATRLKGFSSPMTLGRLCAFAGALAAIWAKVVIVAANDGVTSDNQSQGGPAWVGLWVGAALAFLAFCLLLVHVGQRPARRRRIAIVAAVMAAVTAVAIPYARSGLAWWGGPIAEPAFLGGGNGVGYLVRPGEQAVFEHLLYFGNRGVGPVTFDGLDIVDGSPGIHVLGTYAVTVGRCTSAAVELDIRHPPEGCVYPLEGFRFPPSERGHDVLLAMVFVVREPGLYHSGWFRIRYHAGILPFEVFRTDMLTICAPEPGRRRCPGY